MFYKNARIFASDFQFHMGAFEVKNGFFGSVLPDRIPGDAIDLHGATVIPGLTDIHTHGNSGADFSDGDMAGLKIMAQYYAKCGITSFAATTMTLSLDQLERAFSCAQNFAMESREDWAVLRGIHMEGPYFSYAKRGAQNAEYLRLPDFGEFAKLHQRSEGLIRIVDIAPELPGAQEFIRNVKTLCNVSVAHSDAKYEDARNAFEAGANHVTHLFNAMPGIHHREPGVIPAAAENHAVRAEIICDGYHVHPAVVRLAFQLFGGERMILVSDSGRCCGMPEGSEFNLGDQTAYLQDGVGRLKDGTIACSAVNLFECLVNAMRFGIAEEHAVRAATYNPACAIGAEKEVGLITAGNRADFLVCNKDYSEKRVFLAGREIQ